MTETQLDRIEIMLGKLVPDQNQVGVDFMRRHTVEMFAAMRDGRKIEAIKECRLLAGVGLKEAKDMVCAVMPYE